jgi:hypothetical protein
MVGICKDYFKTDLIQESFETALTVALVPTGMKTGVFTLPCGRSRTPVLAELLWIFCSGYEN